MAVSVLKDLFLSIDGTEFSDHVKEASLEYSADSLDKTAMTDETHKKTGGLKDWGLSVTFYANPSSSGPDSFLFSRVGLSTIALIIRATTAAAGVANPQFSGTALLESYPPISGSVGELAMQPVRFSAAGDLSRAIA